MFNAISQSTNISATTGVSSISIKPGEKIAIYSYSNDIGGLLEKIPNKRLISFIYLPFRKMKWDVLVIYSPIDSQ